MTLSVGDTTFYQEQTSIYWNIKALWRIGSCRIPAGMPQFGPFGEKGHHWSHFANTVEPHYNEVLGTIKITLLYQVSHYMRVKKFNKELGPAKLPRYKEDFVIYPTSL